MARGTYARGGLQEHEGKKYQQRLSHYLRDFRYKNNLKATEAAKLLGYAAPKYSELESEIKPHGRFINSLDFLTALARLSKMTIVEFIQFLSPLPTSQIEGKKGHFLYKWQESLLIFFGHVPLSIRKEFCDSFKELSDNNDREKIKTILNIANSLSKKDLKIAKAVENLVQ